MTMFGWLSRRQYRELVAQIEVLSAKVEAQNAAAQDVWNIHSGEAIKLFADAISGEIVGNNVQGRRQTVGEGSSARID